MLKPAGREVEVAWVDGIVSFPTESIDEAVEEGDRQGWFWFTNVSVVNDILELISVKERPKLLK